MMSCSSWRLLQSAVPARMPSGGPRQTRGDGGALLAFSSAFRAPFSSALCRCPSDKGVNSTNELVGTAPSWSQRSGAGSAIRFLACSLVIPSHLYTIMCPLVDFR
jgi:hypothetical protein